MDGTDVLRVIALAVLGGLLLGVAMAWLQVRADREFMAYVYGPETDPGGPGSADVSALLEEARNILRDAT